MFFRCLFSFGFLLDEHDIVSARWRMMVKGPDWAGYRCRWATGTRVYGVLLLLDSDIRCAN
jgi:hypothetical protein